ncbi:methionine ABC transporter ATP-binding protein [Paenibacillus herberti]|uniref:Methionine ABC transporter ATP-binding protein n=1 Tax=Paenibacillus herberti TaxID=1619309 RepID=A0A229P5M7_9BACL|nr:methionine ABC transporter ATP-binding protein [Paenibacillus herberti]OXM17428.1 methionine ABC transporter ATP-binding protein [Paenibacillus herberti]
MIELQNVTKSYKGRGGSVDAVRDISLQVKPGEIFGIIGHSGAGKSTLIRCMNLLERPTSGRAWFGKTELTALSERQLQAERRKIGMIFQHFNLLASVTVRENIAFPLVLAGKSRKEYAARVDELLALVGLEAHGDKYPSQLSGGQKQRVGIARALAADPQVLLCDEATSALDPQTTNSILSLLMSINEKLGLTIILITHEMQVIRSICDRVAVMDAGRIVEMGAVLDVFLRPTHAVTRQFADELSELESGTPLPRREGSKLVRVHFVGEETYEPVLFEAVKGSAVQCAILQGTVSRMKHTPYGQLLVELSGPERDIDGVITALRSNGLDAEVLS